MPKWFVALAAIGSLAGAAHARQSPARFDWFEYRGDDRLPKARAGEYSNPVLQGFYPDPSVVRVGEDYYLVNSTFAWFPGIPAFHSRDLVNWAQIGNAIDRPEQLNFDKMTMWQGVYAPDISWHDGVFYILNTCVGCGGNFVVTAREPAGPWSQPVWLPEVDGIDTSFFFDDDGTAWIVHNAPPKGKPRYEGHTAIWLHQFDTKTMKTVGKPVVLVDSGVHPDRNPIWIEGPHLFKKDGFYYLIAAEGGTEEGHSEVVFRSDKRGGPYTAGPYNPILTQRGLPKDRPTPITSTGHASFVQTQNGDWWTLFLGVRPYKGNDFNTGRETFLMPVRWQGGWPRVTEPGQLVPWTAAKPNLPASKAGLPTSGRFIVREEFSGKALPSYWLMLRNPTGNWSRTRGGALEIDPKPNAFAEHGNPSLIARRQQHLHASATTKVSFLPASDSAEAGLIAMQSDEHWYYIAIGRDGARRVVRVRQRAGGQDPIAGKVLATAPLPARQAIQLRVEASGATYDFSWSADGKKWHKLLAGSDGTILSTKKSGGFVGAVIGPYAHAER